MIRPCANCLEVADPVRMPQPDGAWFCLLCDKDAQWGRTSTGPFCRQCAGEAHIESDDGEEVWCILCFRDYGPSE